jgi:hypothetical protein
MKKLELEFREFHCKQHQFKVGECTLAMTPPIDKDYWTFRVKLHKDQAVIAFPKFGTMGIGFAIEEDWNTNLPFRCKTEEICKHIWRNRKYEQITEYKVKRAIKILQKASEYYMKHEKPTEQNIGTLEDCKQYFERMMKFVKSKTPFKTTID